MTEITRTLALTYTIYFLIVIIGMAIVGSVGLLMLKIIERIENPEKRTLLDKIGAVIFFSIIILFVLWSCLWLWEQIPVPWL